MVNPVGALWTRSIRRRLILGVAMVHAILMTVFVTDLVHRQERFLRRENLERALGVSQALAANSVSWVLASDVVGLEEVIDSQARLPDLKYVMILDPGGKVLGHTDRRLVGKYVADEVSLGLFRGEHAPRQLFVDEHLIDVCSPIMVNDDLLGWARVGVSQDAITEGLAEIFRDGILYTLLAILAGCVLAFVMARGITRGLRHLVHVAEGIQAGQENLRCRLEREDELGKLGRGLNAMIDALAAQKEQLAVTLRSLAEGVIATDTAGRIVMMNPVACALLGVSERESRHLPAAEIMRISPSPGGINGGSSATVMAGGHFTETRAGEFVLTGADGREFIVALSGAPLRDGADAIVGSVVVFRDVTEEVHLRQQGLRVEKLESLGVLAGGIAHDFNNILTGVLGNIDLAQTGIDAHAEPFQLLDDARKAALRAKGLTQQLLTFAKGGFPVPRPASVAELVRDVVEFNLAGSSVRGEFSIPEDLPPALIDQDQIGQVIQNIVINAVQCMPEGGVLRVSCAEFVATSHLAAALKPGRYVRITLDDTGGGMSADVLAHMFDPYFTTKRDGSGLGLSVSHSIVKKHGGLLEASSIVGQGASLVLYLPVADVEPDPTEGELEPGLAGGGGVVVVMDDDSTIRKLARRTLEADGFEVHEAPDGETALALLREATEQGRDIDLFIMDLTIPGGLGGKEALPRMKEICPQVRAIVSSGYCADTVLSSYAEYGFLGIVPKPYTRKELLMAVHDALRK